MDVILHRIAFTVNERNTMTTEERLIEAERKIKELELRLAVLEAKQTPSLLPQVASGTSAVKRKVAGVLPETKEI